jgi:hypothetical protein
MPPPFSIWIFLSLLAVLLASCAMFWAHVQRWTHNRLWVALGDWAGRNGFRLHRAKTAIVPEPLAQLTLPPPRALVSLVKRGTVLLQMDTPGVSGDQASLRRWNVLVREIDAIWPVTALRPAMHERSLVDLLQLGSFPAILSSDRFSIHGVDSAAARAVVSSVLMALLPHDLGLILHGRRLILDFSTRPFDGIELSRMVSLVEQLAGRLPELKTR